MRIGLSPKLGYGAIDWQTVVSVPNEYLQK
jgi:hypothetical protein